MWWPLISTFVMLTYLGAVGAWAHNRFHRWWATTLIVVLAIPVAAPVIAIWFFIQIFRSPVVIRP